MKDHPIIFNSESVRAILEGRKTQTRRVIKDSCLQSIPFDEVSPVMYSPPFFKDGEWLYELQSAVDATEYIKIKCPYGKVGDRIWVRENICPTVYCGFEIFKHGTWIIKYKADNKMIKCPRGKKKWWKRNWDYKPSRLIPSIHMPKWAARIWLEITGIRIERVQEITFQDMRAEMGTEENATDLWDWVDLWDSINKKRGYSWESNPWVFVIEFKRIEVK